MPDAIVLVGLPASGKSSIGHLLAERAGRPFIDLDALVQRRTGLTPADLIDRHGEAHFRRLEASAVGEASTVPGAVISTGGGAVTDPLNRWHLWHAGTVVWLDAPDEVLLERLVSDETERPLLRGDALASLAGLRDARERFYRAADERIDARGPLVTVADQVARAAKAGRSPARRLFDAEVPREHPMGPPTARVVLGRGLDAATLGPVLAGLSAGVPMVVADARAAAALPDLVAALPAERRLLVPAGERRKRLREAERLLEAASAAGAERGDAWVAVGGGTTTDLVGTAAALYLRGAPFVAVPTTWLAMADAAIGGKVAVDLSAAKNAAGAFWPPVAIVGDVAATATLPLARRLDGMAESLKCGLIGDPGLWQLIEERGRAALRDDEAARYACIERAARLKLAVVARDPFEAGERRTLNLGHTIGHALEVESGYRLPHGQAVVLGLRAVAHMALGRGAEPDLPARIDALARSLGYRLVRRFDQGLVRAALRSDKKRHRGRQRWILPLAVGRVTEVDDVSETELEAALAVISSRGDERVAGARGAA
jgi:shikimate kinase / 3-dehydroquinate synthase